MPPLYAGGILSGGINKNIQEVTMDSQNYIQWLRSKVGHEKIILVFAGSCIFNEKGEVLLQRRADSNKWGFPGGAIELGKHRKWQPFVRSRKKPDWMRKRES